MSKLTPKYRLVDDVYYITCKICNEEKHQDDFHNNKYNTTKRVYICKPCYVDYQNGRKINNISEDELNTIREFLTILGYNTNDNIHQQFLSRTEKRYGVILK